MIQVIIGSNIDRFKKTIDPATTLRTALEENEVNYSVANVHLDGCTLQPGDLDKTFTDFGVTEKCFLVAVVKADNA